MVIQSPDFGLSTTSPTESEVLVFLPHPFDGWSFLVATVDAAVLRGYYTGKWGPVFKSAANAVKGHDSCHCVAVPVREGTEFVPPEHYGSWEDDYKRVIRDDDESVTPARVLREMRTA
jgi:hypothetical protein